MHLSLYNINRYLFRSRGPTHKVNYRHAIHKRVKRHLETDESVQKLNNASRHNFALLGNYFSTLSSLGSVNEDHKQVAFKNFYRDESKAIFHKVNRNKQATKFASQNLKNCTLGKRYRHRPIKLKIPKLNVISVTCDSTREFQISLSSLLVEEFFSSPC